MRICLFGQGPLCEAVSAALRAQGHDLLGPYASPQSMTSLRATQADVGLAVGYRPKVTADERACFKDGVLNCHFSLLPWCAGVGGNYWPILDECPAGVTLHWMDDGFDTGVTVADKEIPVDPWDTAGTLLHKQNAEALTLITRYFAGYTNVVPSHRRLVLSRHYRKEFAALDFPDIDSPTTFRKALNLLRAKTCPPYPGLRYRQDGKLLEATISIKEVTE